MTKVYEYGCRFPYSSDAAHVEHQLALAARHRNTLTELTLKSRARYRCIINEHVGFDYQGLQESIKALNAQIEEVKTELKAWKQRNSRQLRTKVNGYSKVRTEPGLAACLKGLQAERKLLQEQKKGATLVIKTHPEVKTLLEKSETLLENQIKQVRSDYVGQDRVYLEADLCSWRQRTERRPAMPSQADLYWPNYLDNENAARQARFQKMEPKFKAWDGEGKLAIQLQGGLMVPELHKCLDTRLRLIKPAEAKDNGVVPRKARWVRAKYRVASVEGGGPLWIDLEVCVHRMLPEDGVIKEVHLKRVRRVDSVGRRDRRTIRDYDYTLSLTVVEPERLRSGAAHVDVEFGWRMENGTIRVAVAGIQIKGEPLELKPLHLPKNWVERERKAYGLQQVMDKHANEAFDRLIGSHPELTSEVAWVGESKLQSHFAGAATDSINHSSQRSTGKKVAAMLKLYDTRPKLKAELTPWRKQHLHLWRYRRGIEVSLRQQRRDIYRCFVDRLAKRCATCGEEDLNIKGMAHKDLTKDDVIKEVRWQRHVVAVSTLKAMLRNKMTVTRFTSDRALNSLYDEERTMEAEGL
jgi:hypothetical protein